MDATVTDLAQWRGRKHAAPLMEDLALLIRSARNQMGLNRKDFAAVLRSDQLGMTVQAGHVEAWEDGSARVLPDVAEQCRAILAGDLPQASAIACRTADTPTLGGLPELTPELDPQSAVSLWDAAAAIARAHGGSALETFSACGKVRGHALLLAQQTSFPPAIADLHSIAGEMAALMASTAFDLNRWQESARFAQSAVASAEKAGNGSLQAWTLGFTALLANWRNDPDTALDHFRRALPLAPRGTPRARLRFIAARSYALRGDRGGVQKVLEEARRDQDDAEAYADSLCDEVAGEFAFSSARADACAASAWLDLGDGERAAAAARDALDSLAALAARGLELSQSAGAQIDLAAACLLDHERDEAENALGQVITVPSSLRNVSLSGRLVRARNLLSAPYWVGDRTARRMGDALAEWLLAGSDG